MDELERHIKRITTPIFEKFLKETDSNSKTVRRILFRPNNYRRYTALYLSETQKNNLLTTLQTTLFKGSIKWEDKSIEKTPSYSIRNKLLFVKFTNNVTLQLGKDTIVGIYNQKQGNKKIVYEIKGETYEECGNNILLKAKEIQETIDKTIKDFCQRFGIRYGFEFKWERHEDWIKGEEFIDSLPKDMIIHDTVFKKVYGDGIEFKGGIGQEGGVLVKNFLKNRALDVPKIEEKLDDFNDKFNKIITAVEFLAQNINTHIPAVKKLGDNAEKLADEVMRMNSINNNLFEDI